MTTWGLRRVGDPGGCAEIGEAAIAWGAMATYIARRIAQMAVVLFLVSLLIFGIVKLAPGNAARVLAGLTATPEDLAVMEQKMGLDRPLPVQYWRFVSGLFTGTLRPTTFPESMTSLIGRRLLASLELGFVSLIVSVLLSIPAGVVAAIRRNTLWDYGVSVVSLAGISIPVFWIALMAMVVLGKWLRWLPVSGRGEVLWGLSILTADGWRHLVIPLISMVSVQIAMNARLTRSCVLEVLEQEYVRTARAKGIAEFRVVCKHVLRNALIPVVTNIGLMAGMLFGGAILTETVTAWPGVGRLVYQAILQRDEPLLFGLTLLIAVAYQLSFLAVDLVYGLLNPMIVYD